MAYSRSSRRQPDYEDEEFDGDDDMYEAKRRRTEVQEIEDKLENLIIRVGEKSTTSLESNLEGLAQVLETDLASYKSRILKILIKCASGMPQKLTIYTTLVGLLNAKNYNFGGEFVEMLLKALREKLKACDFDEALLLTIFLSDLVNSHVVSAHSCLAFLDNFVDVSLEDSIPQVRSDWFAFCVMCCLPWVGRELYEKKPTELDRMLLTIENYVNKRQKLHLPILRVWSSNRPHPQEEYIDCLWAQISKLRTDKWTERHIMRPYLAFDAVLCDALQHNLPQFVVPSHLASSSYPLPRVVFRMFDYTDCPEEGPVLPGAHSIERFLIELDLCWIIQETHLIRRECSTTLLTYPKKSKIPLNYMVIEIVLSMMFHQPIAPHAQLFYASLLIELCKLEPNSMPQVLAQAAEMLYDRVDQMSATAFDRFVDWFSYHLSQFQFRWSWEEWVDCLEADPLSKKRVFVREVLQKCLRFSYHQRVLDIVPSSFAALCPAKPTANFRFKAEDASSLPGYETAQQLAQMIRQKCTPEEALFVIKDCPNPIGMEIDESGFNPLKVEVLVLTLLHLGSKSFSHSFAALAKYHYSLKALTDNNENAQLAILQAIQELWSTHPQILVVLADKLLKMQIIECAAVVNWIFGASVQESLLRMHIWEILHSTLWKMNKHIEKLRAELEESQDRLEKDKNRSGFDDDDDDYPPRQKLTVQDLEQMEEKLGSARSEQKNLFLLVFQKFTIILTEHLLQSEAEGKDYNTNWYRWVVERLREVFLLHHEDIAKYTATLESLLFTNDIDPHILEVFHQFCALRS